jgi:hypothetical protein
MDLDNLIIREPYKNDVRPLYMGRRMHTYCPLIKRMQLICKACVESLNTRDDGRGKYTNVKSLSLHELLSAGRHLLGAACITSLSQIYAQF